MKILMEISQLFLNSILQSMSILLRGYKTVLTVSFGGSYWFCACGLPSVLFQIMPVVPGIGSFAALFPKSLHLLKKKLRIDQDKFIKYVVCPKCDTLYNFDDCYELQNRKRVSRKCTFIEFSNTGSIFAGHSVMSHFCEKSH